MKLEQYLRTQYYNYIRPLYIKNKCESCGTPDNLELHHVKQFSKLLKETLEEIQLEYKDTNDYTKTELKLISRIMLGKQIIDTDYMTLCNKCHDEIDVCNTNFDYYKKYNYKKIIERKIYNNNVLVPYLNSIIGKRLYKENRQELINVIGTKDSKGRLLKSISLLNAYLNEIKLPYTILNKTDKRRKLDDGSINPNRDKKYWSVEKTILN